MLRFKKTIRELKKYVFLKGKKSEKIRKSQLPLARTNQNPRSTEQDQNWDTGKSDSESGSLVVGIWEIDDWAKI